PRSAGTAWPARGPRRPSVRPWAPPSDPGPRPGPGRGRAATRRSAHAQRSWGKLRGLDESRHDAWDTILFSFVGSAVGAIRGPRGDGPHGRPCRSAGPPRAQYESAEITSPPAIEPRARQVAPLMLSLMNRTEPSPIRALTPPGW